MGTENTGTLFCPNALSRVIQLILPLQSPHGSPSILYVRNSNGSWLPQKTYRYCWVWVFKTVASAIALSIHWVPILSFTLVSCGAASGSRTHTVFTPTDFKSVMSAYSIIAAYLIFNCLLICPLGRKMATTSSICLFGPVWVANYSRNWLPTIMKKV